MMWYCGSCSFPIDAKSVSLWPAIQRRTKSLSMDFGGLGLPNLIYEWVERCSASHERCIQADRIQKPARILDVGLAQGDTIKLVDYNARSTHHYVALSHCWGDTSTVLSTKRRSLTCRKSSVAFEDMPKTFQDAVALTRQLGVRYLWIDALCIVQDDTEDWAMEAAKMGAIYESAWLTISAMSAVDSSKGLFPSKSLAIDVNDMTSKNIPIVYAHRPTTVFPGVDHAPSLFTWVHGRPSEPSWPLISRKWAMQERLLSRRVVHFTAHEMVWECRESLWCECGGVAGKETNKQAYVQEVEEIARNRLDPTKTLHQWLCLVQEYCMMKLTFRDDVLPAFSGIAQDFSDSSLGRYLAGMWEASLPAALCWRSSPNRGRSARELNPPSTSFEIALNRRPGQYVAPTWSWASVDGQISTMPFLYHEFKSTCRAQVLDASSNLSSSDVFGRVSYAVLELWAPVFETVIEHD